MGNLVCGIGPTTPILSTWNPFLSSGSISTWESLEDWRAWEAKPERKELQGKIDRFLVFPSEHRIMVYGA